MNQPHVYPTLRALMNHTLLRITLIATCVAVLSLVATSLLATRHNLQLAAYSLGYTLEAALVFGDIEAADEALQLIAFREALGSVQVYDRHGVLFTRWHSDSHSVSGALDRVLSPVRIRQPVMHGSQVVGELVITSNTDKLVAFLRNGILLMLAGLALIILGTLFLTNRIIRKISKPLQNLTRVAHKVRYERNFEARVPPAPIAELNDLCEDFNELLMELQAWNRLQEREKAVLNHQASHDSLTGLANRSLFESTLARTRLKAHNEQSRFAVLYIDVDNFKHINDSMGHDTGDLLLKTLASRLSRQVRTGDTVARLGGDEFAILLPELSTIDDAGHIAEAIIRNMQQPLELAGGQQLRMSLSIGISLYPDDAHDLDDLVRAADSAMYAVKRSGRGRWQRINTPCSPHPTKEDHNETV